MENIFDRLVNQCKTSSNAGEQFTDAQIKEVAKYVWISDETGDVDIMVNQMIDLLDLVDSVNHAK
ncbi:hypothetical protein EOM81_01710 [bacterium]|nr:hypothetical protein [bacterium]